MKISTMPSYTGAGSPRDTFRRRLFRRHSKTFSWPRPIFAELTAAGFSAVSANWRPPSANSSPPTTKPPSLSFGPKRPTKSSLASPATPNALSPPNPGNLSHEPLGQETSGFHHRGTSALQPDTASVPAAGPRGPCGRHTPSDGQQAAVVPRRGHLHPLAGGAGRLGAENLSKYMYDRIFLTLRLTNSITVCRHVGSHRPQS